MIVIDNGILLESSDNIKNTSITGEAAVGHDRIERALGIASSIRYDATSLKAVQCILNSSARNRVCIPLCNSDSTEVAAVRYEMYNEEKDRISLKRQKLVSLLINRNVVAFGEAIDGYLRETKKKDNIMYLSVDNHATNIKRQSILTKRDHITIDEAVELSDELWQAGYVLLKIYNTIEITNTHIKRIKVARNGREVKMPAVDIIRQMFGVMSGE